MAPMIPALYDMVDVYVEDRLVKLQRKMTVGDEELEIRRHYIVDGNGGKQFG